MEKKIMPPIVHMIALSCSTVLIIFAVGFLYIGKLNQWSFLIMIALSIVVGFGIEWGVKKFWFKVGSAEVGLDTFKADLDEYTQQKLKEIQTDINLHKESITTILKDANKASERLSEHEQSINNLVTQAVQIESDLKKTIQMARPPILQLKSFESKKRGGGISKTFTLVPDKNVALGQVIISAKVDDNYSSKIIQMDYKGSLLTVSGKAILSPDAREANKLFHTPVPVPLLMEIVVTDPCKVFILGSHIIEPNIIEVEKPPD